MPTKLNFFKSKRATDDALLNLLRVIIIAIIVLAIMIFVVYKIVLASNKCFNKNTCMASVIANSKARIPLVNNEMVPINCPTRYLVFDEEGYTEEVANCNDNKPKRIQTFKDKDDNKCSRYNINSEEFAKCYFPKMNKAVADAITDCWDQFGAGYLNVFSSYTSARQCVVCSVIEFSQELVKEFGDEEICMRFISYENEPETYRKLCLDEYMRTTLPDQHDITYYEYATDVADGFAPPYYDVDMSSSYAIIFSAWNENNIKSTASDLWGYIENNHDPKYDWLLGSKSVGDKENIKYVNTLQFVPQEYVVDYCDTLETTTG
ncbi:MAG: hypothetical protein V1859_06060 [archaeon]